MEIQGGPPGGVSSSSREGVAVYEWVLLALAVVALAAAGYGYVGSFSSTYAKELRPVAQGGGTVYTSAAIPVEPGLYNVKLSMRLNVTGFGFAPTHTFTVTSQTRPGWSESETLSWSKRSKKDKKRVSSSSSRYQRKSSTFPLRLGGADDGIVFVVTTKDPVKANLTLSLRPTPFDYRFPLALGLLLLVGVAVLSPGLRNKLLALGNRSRA